MPLVQISPRITVQQYEKLADEGNMSEATRNALELRWELREKKTTIIKKLQKIEGKTDSPEAQMLTGEIIEEIKKILDKHKV
jgi:Arc/MetJ-type ribon-helix-helix transcriptional regulator